MTGDIRYNPDYHDQWAWSLTVKGATDEDIADAFKVCKRTIIRWRQQYPSFAEACAMGKDAADARIEKALYERATGFDYEETKITQDIDPDTGKPKAGGKMETNRKHQNPDTMAIMYWLNNRRRGEWAQKQTVELSADEDSGIEVRIYLPDDGRGGDGA